VTAEILKPVAVLIAWSLIMWLWLYATRLPAIARSGEDASTWVGTVGADLRAKLPAATQWKADNYNHLMEQPTLFYALALLLAMIGHGDGINAMLGWAYVAFRIVHSLVQATVNRVVIRFALHLLGTIPLIALALHAVISVF
jgi:hypothetical protein